MQLFKRTVFLIGTLLTFTIVPTLAQSEAIHKTDSILSATFSENGPGGVFLVAKGADVLYKKAYGKANLELNTTMETHQIFEIGSMTKQFTAIGILQLVEQGKLQLEDPITTFLTDYPTQGHTITVHHLLTHTSGIKNFTSIPEIGKIATQNLSPIELIDFFKNQPMDFEPGTEFKYNNSGYVLLGYIIEKVSGQSYEDYIQEHVFKPLNMHDSQYASSRRVIPNRAYGYHGRKGTYTNAMHISFSIPYASGSLMSTAEDMLKWERGVLEGKLLTQSTLQKVFQPHSLSNGTPITYGYGWHIRDYEGITHYEHGGSIFGFKSMGVYLPDEDIYVIGLTNCDCNSPTQLVRDIALLFAKEAL